MCVLHPAIKPIEHAYDNNAIKKYVRVLTILYGYGGKNNLH